MERWAASHPASRIDPASISAILETLNRGEALPDSLLGIPGYDAETFAADWTELDPPRVGQILGDSSGQALSDWLTDSVRQAEWASAAREMGDADDAAAGTAAARGWEHQLQIWGAATGFRQGMTGDQIVNAALQATLSGTPDVRSIRLQLRSLRPLLRIQVPVVLPDD